MSSRIVDMRYAARSGKSTFFWGYCIEVLGGSLA